MKLFRSSTLAVLVGSTCLAASTLFGSQGRQVEKTNQPAYPEIALKMRVEGTVKLEAVVDRDGKVEKVIIITGNPLLRDAAADCVKQWKYQPSSELSVERIDVNFKLPD